MCLILKSKMGQAVILGLDGGRTIALRPMPSEPGSRLMKLMIVESAGTPTRWEGPLGSAGEPLLHMTVVESLRLPDGRVAMLSLCGFGPRGYRLAIEAPRDVEIYLETPRRRADDAVTPGEVLGEIHRALAMTPENP